MKVKVLSFGITRDVLGEASTEWETNEGATVSDFKNELYQKYPSLTKLNSLRIAVNEEYGDDALVLKENDEVVLIPPVSGG